MIGIFCPAPFSRVSGGEGARWGEEGLVGVTGDFEKVRLRFRNRFFFSFGLSSTKGTLLIIYRSFSIKYVGILRTETDNQRPKPNTFLLETI